MKQAHLDEIDQLLQGFIGAVHNSRIALIGSLSLNHEDELIFELHVGFLEGVGGNGSSSCGVGGAHRRRAGVSGVSVEVTALSLETGFCTKEGDGDLSENEFLTVGVDADNGSVTFYEDVGEVAHAKSVLIQSGHGGGATGHSDSTSGRFYASGVKSKLEIN